jgi:hypothetical protein
MALLKHQNRYDRLTSNVEKVTGTPPLSIYDFVLRHAAMYMAGEREIPIMKRIGWSLGLVMLPTSAPARDDGRMPIHR